MRRANQKDLARLQTIPAVNREVRDLASWLEVSLAPAD
jgi:hypothetical protein